jgi:hypothetical protein
MTGHIKTTNYFLGQSDDDNNTNINRHTSNEGEKAKWVLCNFFLFGFCDGSFFSLCISLKPKKFFITKNLIIIYKLNTINGFYHKVNDFAMVLVFLSFCYSLKEIAKGKENKRN